MIESIKLIKGTARADIKYQRKHLFKIEMDTSFIDGNTSTIKITFKNQITKFRNHDYTWNKIESRQISNWYGPKVLILENGQRVQASKHIGIWEVNPINKRQLLWHFNLKNAQSIVQYGHNNNKRCIRAFSVSTNPNTLSLLFPVDKAVEVSRSKIPFSAIACFTDHCDFDTALNMKRQRQFFKSHNIKVTKGFFLNHYSKRQFTASYEKQKDEIDKWTNDGHELAYHSLSQSIKSITDSIDDFKSFSSPQKSINVWIDHGYQPYNVSQYSNHMELADTYGSILKTNGVNVIWNYIDSGSIVGGVINQLNPAQFTLKNYFNGIKHLKLKARIVKLIKTIIFYYFNNSNSLKLYYNLVNYFKSTNHKNSYKRYFKMVVSSFKLLRLISPVMLLWNKTKNKVFPLAEYGPLIFDHDISGNTFVAFQTLEMTDFTVGLNQKNIDLLIKESGLFIGHTYFSDPLDHHQGKLFKNENEIDKQVVQNFSYLSNKIKSKAVWNPILSELVNHLKKFEAVMFDCNEDGMLQVIDNNNLPIRKV